jgi:maleate cis-trans isomerase
LQKAGVTALALHSFDELGVPKRMTPQEVFELTKKNLLTVGQVDAIYFQGAVLDPIKVLDKIESELKTTVVASNPAMFWYLLSKLKFRYPRSGYGRLMREWPALPA